MKVLLLAAGLGTRLRPLTDFTPKCLVPIKGQALLGIWLDRLTAAGFGPFLINTHYLSEQVNEFIAASGHAAHVTLVSEPILRGTAGTLIDNLDFFEGQDGLVIHADNYCLADFHAFLKAHQTRPSHCEMTMMTFMVEEEIAKEIHYDLAIAEVHMVEVMLMTSITEALEAQAWEDPVI